jgi:threonine 3-dehydrogenase
MSGIPETVPVPHFVGGAQIKTTRKSVPTPGPGQLLVQVKANALCGSERPQFRDGTEVTPGHEAAGVVVASGSETKTPVGTPGAIFLMDFCGQCRSCRHGFTNQCLAKRADMGFSHDGGYGVYELVNENIFFPTSPEFTATEATLLLDIMGTGGHAIRRAQIAHRDIESLVIAGAGPIGLGVLAMARIMLRPDIPVYIFDMVDYRLSLAEKLGGKPISVAGGKTLAEGLRRYGVESVDIAVDTSGKKIAREASLNSLAQRGALILVGHGEELRLEVSPDMIAPERSVLGSEYFAYSELAINAKYLAENRAYLNKIITHRFGVDEIQHAFELFFAGETGKVIIEQ